MTGRPEKIRRAFLMFAVLLSSPSSPPPEAPENHELRHIDKSARLRYFVEKKN